MVQARQCVMVEVIGMIPRAELQGISKALGLTHALGSLSLYNEDRAEVGGY